MTKIVIPYVDFKGLELKYCLRGIEKFVDDPEITIIGDQPNWIKNVRHIPFKDNLQNQFRSKNIYDKIMLVDYDFLFFNDDHFLLKPFTLDTFHYSGTMQSELSQAANNIYKRTVQNTFNLYGDIKNFDTHCPIFYKHDILKQINLDWTKPHGYCIKSIYAIIAGIEGTEYPDLKIRTFTPEEKICGLIKDRPYFSTANFAVDKAMVNIWESLYPEKSIYE